MQPSIFCNFLYFCFACDAKLKGSVNRRIYIFVKSIPIAGVVNWLKYSPALWRPAIVRPIRPCVFARRRLKFALRTQDSWTKGLQDLGTPQLTAYEFRALGASASVPTWRE